MDERRMKYTKIPTIVDAIQWLGYSHIQDLKELEPYDKNQLSFDHIDGLVISTDNGDVTVNFEDYIIKGIDGELYPCKPNVFKKTYVKSKSSIESSPDNYKYPAIEKAIREYVHDFTIRLTEHLEKDIDPKLESPTDEKKEAL